MANTQEFITVIRLNDEDAKKSLQDLEKRVANLKTARDKAVAGKQDASFIKELNKQLKTAEAELKSYQTNVSNTFHTINNLGTASVDEIKKAMKAFQRAKAGVTDASEYAKLESNIEKCRTRLAELSHNQQLVNKTMDNLSGAKVKDLEYTLKLLNGRLKETKKGTEEYKRLNEQLKKVKKSLREIAAESEESKSLWAKAADFFNTNWGVITQGIAAVTGLTVTVRKCVDSFASMDTAMNNTRKYTGQTMEQVKLMNEDFKQMDTRTSREQLNELAGAAGRLGISSTEAVEEFVDAADKIGVALGDDLGDGAVDKIGKLAMAFGEDDRLGLRGAMLATGSAINELAQNSPAQAGYLVEFTARVAGVGKQLHIAQADILGFGAVLDENMQKDEMAATAFSQLLSKMASDTTTFAKLAGMETKKFSDLVKNDANAAVITLMKNLKSQGGFEQMAKMFEDMGLDGTRALSVLTTIADKINDVEKYQRTANEAYREAKSVIEEFDIQNDTVQAGIDKAKKSFNDISVELGEKLLPVARLGITTGSLAVKTLKILVDAVTDYWKILLVATAGLTAYQMAVKAVAIEEAYHNAVKKIGIALDKTYAFLVKAKTVAVAAYNTVLQVLSGRLSLAAAAQKLLNAVTLSNPWVAAAVAMAGMTAALVKFSSKADNATEAQKRLASANKEAAADCRQEIVELDALARTARDKSIADDTRREAIRKLQDKYPDYLKNLSLENINSTETRKSIDNLTSSILGQAKARVYLSKIEEMQRKQMDIEEEYLNSWWGKMQHTFTANFQSFANQIAMYGEKISNTTRSVLYHGSLSGWDDVTSIEKDGYGTTPLQAYMNNMHADIKEYKEYEKEYLAEYKKIQQEEAARLAEIRKQAQAEAEDNSGIEYKSEEELKKEAAERRKEEARKRKEEAMKNKQLKEAVDAQKAIASAEHAENLNAYSRGETSYREFIERKHQIALNDLDEQIKIYGKDSEKAQKLIEEKENLLMQYYEHTRRMDEEDIRRNAASNAVALQTAYEDRNSELYHNDRALQEALFQNEMESLFARRDLYAKDSEEWLNIDAEIIQRDEEHCLQLRQQYADLLASYREQWGQRDIAEEKRIALQGLDELHARGLLSEEEYLKMRNEMKLRYAQMDAEQERDNSVQATTSRNASTAYQTALARAQSEMGNSGKPSLGSYLMGDIELYKSTMEQLREIYGEDAGNFEDFQEAKSLSWGRLTGDLVDKLQAAYDMITPILNGMSAYWNAQAQYEQNVTTKKYDKLIEAAGDNTKKRKKLEEKKEKELAAIKTKANKKAMVMELAQATATMVLGAMSAYTGMLKAIPGPKGLIMAPIAAGIATAAGMLNIATIKKQHEAEAAGYYSGGFTGGNNYHREAGVVHEGEFVANHRAVGNSRILPALQLIDQAQRNNTVASLTADDITRAVGGGATVVSAPTVNVQTDNTEVVATMAEAREVITNLSRILEGGIHASVTMDGEDGFVKAQRRWNKLQANK